MIKSVVLAATAVVSLAGCNASTPGAAASPEATSGAAAAIEPSTPSPVANGSATQAAPIAATPLASTTPLPTPEASKGEQGARSVLLTWAKALESGQFGLAWEQFGDQPPATRAAYTKWWQRYRTIKVALGAGEGDAAMGSLYYTVPATLTGTTVDGKPFRLRGDVVVRRVNDVDGATPAQLRWHIGTADLKDAGGR